MTSAFFVPPVNNNVKSFKRGDDNKMKEAATVIAAPHGWKGFMIL